MYEVHKEKETAFKNMINNYNCLIDCKRENNMINM